MPYRARAEGKGLDPDALLGPISGLTDKGKRDVVQQARFLVFVW